MPFVRDQDVFYTVAGDELIIMDQGEEKFMTSNAVGGLVWERLETPATLDELCDLTLSRFAGGEREDVRADLAEFLDALESRGLIRKTVGA